MRRMTSASSMVFSEVDWTIPPLRAKVIVGQIATA